MARFEDAFGNLIKLEGGFINDPDDPGGATNYGISLMWLKRQNDLELGDIDEDGDIDEEDIRKMTIQDAAKLYKKHWWDEFGLDNVPQQAIATKLFSLLVNVGRKQGFKILQRAINTVGEYNLTEDGVLGPKTGAAFSTVVSRPDWLVLLIAIKAHQEGFYRALVAQRPSLSKFLNGWINRARD